METYQLSINAYDRPGSLERILRVVRHRGCRIMKMNMQSDSESNLNPQISLNFELTHVKSKEQIVNQLTKLEDILSVN